MEDDPSDTGLRCGAGLCGTPASSQVLHSVEAWGSDGSQLIMALGKQGPAPAFAV